MKRAELAGTTGLLGGSGALEMPEAPEPAAIPERIPEIPSIAELPEVAGAGVPAGEVAATEITSPEAIDYQELREARRLEEEARDAELEIDLSEKFAESATAESVTEGAGHYELGEVHPTVEEEVSERRPPPPPPIESADERVVREGTDQQGVSDAFFEAEEVSASRFLLAAVVILLLMLMLVMLAGYLIELTEQTSETDTALRTLTPISTTMRSALQCE